MTSSQMVEFPKEGLRESLDLDAQMPQKCLIQTRSFVTISYIMHLFCYIITHHLVVYLPPLTYILFFSLPPSYSNCHLRPIDLQRSAGFQLAMMDKNLEPWQGFFQLKKYC